MRDAMWCAECQDSSHDYPDCPPPGEVFTTWLLREIAVAKETTQSLLSSAQHTNLTLRDPKLLRKHIPGGYAWPEVEKMCQQRIAELDVSRRIIDEHQPTWRTVEWPHDQNGKGEAQVCRRCQNAEHSTWNPPVGHAGVLPEGFIVPYVLAPCPTLRLLVQPFAEQPGYRDEWRPQ